MPISRKLDKKGLASVDEALAQKMVNTLRSVFSDDLAARVVAVDSFEAAYAKIAADESSGG